MKNLVLLTDSYKTSHHKQYPADTRKIYSYFESRKGADFDHTLFFGLQYLIKEYLAGKVVTSEDVDEAAWYVKEHMGPNIFNEEGWRYIVREHNGRLPIRIKAVPEGTEVPSGNVLMTVENTDPNCFWLTNYLETLLCHVWYASTVATLSKATKNLILGHLDRTGTPELVDFKLHDFGFRGVSSVESAGIGGLAHLVNFKGTDTMEALVFANKYYNNQGAAGFSIPASEHSTMTSWADETEAMRNMLTIYPTGLVACVSDSYDIYNACENIWGGKLKDMVMNRNGTLVVRPDSGDIVEVTLKVIKTLADAFGCEQNQQGYWVLNDKVRVIQGDGCTYDTIRMVLDNLEAHAFSADNIAFGMGGGLLQRVNRDTQRFAFKCSQRTDIHGTEHDVFKTPITDPGKNSKRGRLALIQTEDGFQTVKGPHKDDLLVTVFENGVLLKDYTFEEVRERSNVRKAAIHETEMAVIQKKMSDTSKALTP